MIWLAFLRVAWPYLLGAVIAGGLWYAEDHRCNSACKVQTKRADALLAEKVAAQKAVAAIAVKYGEQVAATQSAEVQLEGERNARFAAVEAAARGLPAAVARIRVPAAAVVVLDNAIAAGNAAIAGSSAGVTETARAPPADSNLENVVAWGVTCARQHAELAAEVVGWQRFYSGLQAAQISEQLH